MHRDPIEKMSIIEGIAFAVELSMLLRWRVRQRQCELALPQNATLSLNIHAPSGVAGPIIFTCDNCNERIREIDTAHLDIHGFTPMYLEHNYLEIERRIRKLRGI